jgi:hypothetical protein
MQRSFVSYLLAGVGSGMVVGLSAAYLGTWMGMHELGGELTAGHVIAACVIVNIVGGAGYYVLVQRSARPQRAYLAVALGLAVLASVKLLIWPPSPGTAAIADTLHVFVALASSLVLPHFVGAPTGARMRLDSGTLLLALVAIGGPLSSLIMDFNESHVYNAAWSQHARYHGFMFMNLLVAVGALSLALITRPAPSAETRLRITLVVPDASSWPDGFDVVMPVNGNVIMALLMLVLTAIGSRLALRQCGAESR